MISITTFLRAEHGAVTVDWVVLTAASVGLGLGAIASVRTGVFDLGAGIQGSLSNAAVAGIGRLGFGQTLLTSMGFDDGNFDGWSHARSGHSEHWGTFLGPFGNELNTTPLEYTVQLAEDAKGAVIEFDMLIIDGWDGRDPRWSGPNGDAVRLMIDGHDIAREVFVDGHEFRNAWNGGQQELWQDRSSSIQIGDASYRVTMALAENGQNFGIGARYDSTWRVRVEAINVPTDFKFGLQTDLNQPQHSESVGLDNFRVTELR